MSGDEPFWLQTPEARKSDPEWILSCFQRPLDCAFLFFLGIPPRPLSLQQLHLFNIPECPEDTVYSWTLWGRLGKRIGVGEVLAARMILKKMRTLLSESLSPARLRPCGLFQSGLSTRIMKKVSREQEGENSALRGGRTRRCVMSELGPAE